MNARLSLALIAALAGCKAEPKPEPASAAPAPVTAPESAAAPVSEAPSGPGRALFDRIEGAAPASVPTPATVAVAAAPEKLTATAGSNFTLSLPANATTGFSWKVVEPLDPHLNLVEQTYETEPGEPMPGRGGTAKLVFQAVTSGVATLTLVYVRPWEQGPAEITRSWEVTIP